MQGTSVGSPLSCNPGSDYGEFLALAHHVLMYVVVLGLSGLQHNPVGNHVTANAFIGIDFNNEADFVKKEFMVFSFREKKDIHHGQCF